ncbi:membrane protein containing CHASE2 [Candidatus Magnetoovum chiemensis]|nr:membrane protein containing CHASE2 [Candidatus Magnetoovum chiemensis]
MFKTLRIKNLLLNFTYISIILCLVFTLLVYLRSFDEIELEILNKGYQFRDAKTADPSIVSINIDDYAIAEVGRWPWQWTVHSDLIDFLTFYKAKAVVFFNIDFSRQNVTTYPEDKIKNIGSNIESYIKGSIGSRFAISKLLSLDKDFFASIKKNGSVFIPYKFVFEKTGDKNVDDLAEIAQTSSLSGKAADRDRRKELPALSIKHSLDTTDIEYPIASAAAMPLNEVLANAKDVGFEHIIIDKDGIVRKYQLIAGYREKIYPSILLSFVRDLLSIEKIEVSNRFLSLRTKNETINIPITDKAEMYVNWIGKYKDEGAVINIPFALTSLYIIHQKAKEETSRIFMQSYEVSDEDLINKIDILTKILEEIGLKTKDQLKEIAESVVYSYFIEYYITHTDKTVANILEELGLEVNNYWAEIGNQIAYNNTIYELYKKIGSAPDFDYLLNETGYGESDDLDKDTLINNYEIMKFLIEEDKVDKARPLYFYITKLQNQSDPNAEPITILPTYFKDKTAIYGLSATGLTAQHPTPFMRRHPMIDLLPSALNTVLSRDFLYPLPDYYRYVICYIFILIVVLLIQLQSPLRGGFFTFVLSLLYLYGAWTMFTRRGLIMPVASPILAGVLSYMTVVIVRYRQERKERSKVRSMFSTMVSPEVLKIIENNSSALALTGEKREATMFSSDVSGFTTISEGVTSRELANILNIYLTPMSNIIMSYGGYVDKYEGDAIKADFGVPLLDSDHAWKACYAALYQQEEISIIQRMILLKYGVKITARMGINTGVVCAGNMGSDKHIQYTVMGEAATAAEELEPSNKLFNTWIMIGQNTFDKTAEYVHTRYLGAIKLGHSIHKQNVYELLGWNRDAFLKYWIGKPIPELMLELFRKMAPEKVIAFYEYLEAKELPKSKLLNYMLKTFSALTEKAIDYMFNDSILSVTTIIRELKNLHSSFKKLNYAIEDEEDTDTFKSQMYEIDEMILKEKEIYRLKLLSWKKELKEYEKELNSFKEKMQRPHYESLLNMIDVLAKNVECISKRIEYGEDRNDTARKLADSLKELVSADENTLLSYNINEINNKKAALNKEITAELNRFAEMLKLRADEYHTFVSNLCALSENAKAVLYYFNKGQELYYKNSLKDAYGRFKQYLYVNPDDGPTILYIKNIRKKLKNASKLEKQSKTNKV